jgi:hypothetical protein
MKNILKFTAILLILVGNLSSCDKLRRLQINETDVSFIFQPPITSMHILAGTLLVNSGDSFPKQNLVIKTQAEWDTLKKKIYDIPFCNCGERYYSDIDDIDFMQYQIIAIFDEVRTDTICFLDIADMANYSSYIDVTVEHRLRKNIFNSSVLQSFCIVMIPISEKNIVFQNKTAIMNMDEHTGIQREDIIGKWKLTKIDTNMPIQIQMPRKYIYSTTYYAQYNIVYDFRENNRLIVSGIIYGDNLPTGEHFYRYEQNTLGYVSSKDTNLQINNEKQGCIAYERDATMTISTSQGSDFLTSTRTDKYLQKIK